MDRSDFETFIIKLHGFYPQRFGELGPDMAHLWFETLTPVEEDLAEQALRRWARQHTVYPPSLDELLEQVEFVREDQQRSKRHGSSTKTYLDVLKDAADREAATPERSAEDVTYARLMVLLTERAIDKWQDKQGTWHDKLTIEQCGAECYKWADYYADKRPALADDLRGASRKFASILAAEKE